MSAEALNYTYAYPFQSVFERVGASKKLVLATSSKIHEFPYFFTGRLLFPARTAQQLLIVSRIAGTRFYKPPSMVAKMIRESDPVVTSGAKKLRFESFSECCGVYCRLDLMENAIDGAFMGNGTTNVDFNHTMRDALAGISNDDDISLTVGSDRVELATKVKEVIERQVQLPFRWYKGFVEVQAYAASLKPAMNVPGPAVRRFLQTLPSSVPSKSECHLVLNRSGLKTSRRPIKDSVLAGGIERLRCLGPLAKDVESMNIYSCDKDSVTAYEMIFPESRFTMIISPYACRGFSGEGQVLEHLISNADESSVEDIRLTLKHAAQLSEDKLIAESQLSKDKILAILAILGSRGQVGFDQNERVWFYREFPFKTKDLEAMHPRLNGARQLVERDAIEIISRDIATITEAYVKGTGVQHRVRFVKEAYKCTCDWYNKTQSKQGDCKHVLAIQILNNKTMPITLASSSALSK